MIKMQWWKSWHEDLIVNNNYDDGDDICGEDGYHKTEMTKLGIGTFEIFIV